ncbi:ABC transporter ATP-binding protein [Dechloromonas sp. TW-R-39-2]|uniref:ABC transporter ATP-binding protein n=1 Tax=Dechloromonas sp. TW-R-39-2 TaxID=2654218 RepID=UPI001EEF7C2E|nr:ATP-binding cassette domain-containing protein [Dechloromonas sp. TW-R-39-2]
MAGVGIIKQLSISALNHRFGYQRVLDNINLTVHAGEAVALVGPSGCGKTTLLNLAAGLLAPWEGRIDNGFSRPAMMFQQPRLLPWKRTLENIALGLKAQGIARPERTSRARQLALSMGLDEDDLDKFPGALSGGMQSRAALARAFAVQPDLLLLDEAFSALDIGLKSELYDLLARERAAHASAVLMITHDLMEAIRLADRILIMTGSPGAIVAEHRLETPVTERDESWVFAHTAEFIQWPDVRAAFALVARK